MACFALASVPCAGHAQAMVVEVIEARYRDAGELAALLWPLVPPPGTIGVLGRQMVVRTTPANLAELRRVLSAVDKRPTQLDISVTEDVDLVLAEQQLDAVNTQARPGVRVHSSETAGQSRRGRRVRGLEGVPVFIAVGETRPAAAPIVTYTPDGRRIVQASPPRTTTSGFRARARLDGDRVTVEISAQRQQVSTRDPRVTESSGADTVVSGRLGTWIEVGGVSEIRRSDENAIVYRSTEAADDRRRWFLKVERADDPPRER